MTKRKPLIGNDGEVRELEEADLTFFRPTRGRPPLPDSEKKRRTTLMLDPDVLRAAKEAGINISSRANELLRKDMGL